MGIETEFRVPEDCVKYKMASLSTEEDNNVTVTADASMCPSEKGCEQEILKSRFGEAKLWVVDSVTSGRPKMESYIVDCALRT